MGIEKITEKILSEARNDADQILEKAGCDGRDTLHKAQLRSDNIKRETEERGNEDAVLMKSRKVSVAELEARKMKLAAKQGAITKAFDLALEKLENMEKNDYIRLLVKAISETGVDGGELLLNQKDHDFVGQKVVELANASSSSRKVTLSEQTIGAKGGFVLRKGAVEINSTLETMVNAVRESVTPEVVEVLFR